MIFTATTDPMVTATMQRPDVLTKELRLLRDPVGGGRRFLLSSNFLDAFGFSPNTRIDRQVPTPGQGLVITSDPAGATKVYQRQYARRRANPFETQLDIKTQALLNAAFPGYIERVHITFEAGKLTCVPVPERAASLRFRHRHTSDPLNTFIALSSGIDAASLARLGFHTRSLLEWRPVEKRDVANGRVRDLTESGVMTACANTRFAFVCNEDFRTADVRRIRAFAGDEGVAFFHCSLQCDDHSPLKTNALKARHLADLDTTRDLAWDFIRFLADLEPVTALIENVPGFLSSPEYEMIEVKARRMGYYVHSIVADARDFGGLSSRRRAYIFFTPFKGFAFPQPTRGERPAGWLWDTCIADELEKCRDVSHTSSVRGGFETGRIRLLTPESTCAPTITKSQPRQAKDSVFIHAPDGRILFPTETIIQRLMGIPAEFSFAATSSELAAEQIGQSIDVPMHEAIACAVRDHLIEHWQGGALKDAPGVAPSMPVVCASPRAVAAGPQFALGL